MNKILPAILLILTSTILVCGQKTFENKKFGFSMQEPKGWIVTTNDELRKNLEKFDLTEDKLAEIIKNSKTSIMLAAYYKYEPSSKTGIIPKIQVDVRPNPTKDFQHFKTSLTQFTTNLKKYFTDYELIQEPQEVVVSGVKSVAFVGKFTMKAQSGQQLKVRARVYAIPYKSYFFQVNFVDGQVEEDNSKLFDGLVKTIKIGN